MDNQDQVDRVLFEKIDRLHTDLNRETNLIKAGCERDIRKVDDRLRVMEKKMWSIFGALSVISFLLSPVGQKIIRPVFESSQAGLTNPQKTTMIYPSQVS